MGVREAPFLGVPSLDVGTRQSNRGLTDSLSQCAAHDRATIDKFIKVSWGQRFPSSQNFGTGDATKRFVELLERDSFWITPQQKYFVE
jgi:UDP-N-acetylglucosamine 2-epimerase (hydrolysing)